MKQSELVKQLYQASISRDTKAEIRKPSMTFS